MPRGRFARNVLGMRAVVITEHGPREVLLVEERPDPVGGPGQVVIDVAARRVSLADLMARAAPDRLSASLAWGNRSIQCRTVATVTWRLSPEHLSRSEGPEHVI